MKYSTKSNTTSHKFYLISALLIIGSLVYTDVSLARGGRASGSVRHSLKAAKRTTARTTTRTTARRTTARRTTARRTTRAAARPGGPVTIQPVRRPRGTVRVGRRVTVLPAGHRTVVVGGTNYYYRGGVYYRRGPSGGYVVAVAPVGAVVARRPRGYATVYVEDDPYYYYNGAYYVETDDGYIVVEPPEGVTVAYLPAGSTAVYVNGTKHYAYGGVHYRPYSHEGRVVYRVVRV